MAYPEMTAGYNQDAMPVADFPSSGVYRYSFAKDDQCGNEDYIDMAFVAQLDGAFIVDIKRVTDDQGNDTGPCHTEWTGGAGQWDGQTLHWDWRASSNGSVRKNWVYTECYKSDLVPRPEPGTLPWFQAPFKAWSQVELVRSSESVDDVTEKLREIILKDRLQVDGIKFTDLPQHIATKAAEADAAKAAAAKATEEKVAAKQKADAELSEKLSTIQTELPELNTLFEEALARGLTDEIAVSTMWRNICTGRFEAEMYVGMWKKRLA